MVPTWFQKRRQNNFCTKHLSRFNSLLRRIVTDFGTAATVERAIALVLPLERIMREIRRRTRVVGAFPDGNSALMLVAARLRHIAGTKWGLRQYLKMDRLEDQARELAA